MKDLVSIIVPIFNVEKYVEDCINSIRFQTYKNLQIILVDDDSHDSSLRICKEAAKCDRRIEVLHKKNGGAGSARNFGLAHARGKYVAFVDGDDTICNNYIERLYTLCEENDVKIAQCSFSYGANERLKENENTENQLISGVDAIKACCFGFDSVKYNVIWNKLYDRSLFDFIRFTEGKIYEDEATVYKIFHRVNGVVITTECLYNYRQRENSVMSQPFSEKKLDLLYAYKGRIEFLESIGLNSERDIMLMKSYEITMSLKDMAINYIGISKNLIYKQLEQYADFFKKEILDSATIDADRKKEYLTDLTGNQLRYRFPYDAIPHGSKIVIYGAAEIGRSFYKQLRDDKGYCLQFLVDQRWMVLQDDEYDVRSITELLECSFDYIVIAVALLETAKSIEKTLLEMGIPKEKIVWQEPVFLCEKVLL